MKLKKYILPLVLVLILAGASYGGYWWTRFQRVENVAFGLVGGGSSAELLIKIIKAEKLDKKNRINIIPEFIPVPAELERRFEARERLDAAAFGIQAVTLENLRGGNARIIGPNFLNPISIMVQKDSPYYSIADLKGTRVASRAKMTVLYISFAVVLKKMGIDPETYFSLVFPPTIAESGKLLERGDVDASVTPEPLTSQLLATGKYREIARLRDLWREMTGQPFGFTYTITYQDWIDAHPRAAKRLVATIINGGRLINAKPEILENYKGLLEIKTDEEMKLLKERLPQIFTGVWDETAIKNVELELQAYVDTGVLPEKPKESIVVRLK